MATFRLASSDTDDQALAMLSREEMITSFGEIMFSRGETFFSSLASQYKTSSVAICCEGGEVLGMGVCSHIHATILGSAPCTIGYFNQLRSKKSARGLTFLARAYRFMKSICAEKQLPLYISTILETNHEARGILESGRAGMPAYVPIARLGTVLMRTTLAKKFIARTADVRQSFSLSTACGKPYSWDQSVFRKVLLQKPTLSARFTASALLRSVAPLVESEIELPLRYLTNWDTPSVTDMQLCGGMHALTLDTRDARFAEALRSASHTTYSILYGVAWEDNEQIARLVNSDHPVYVDAGLL